MGDEAEQTQVPEPVTGSGKFYYPDGATYEGEWLLIPEPESTGDEATAEDDAAAEEGSAPAAAETEEAAPSSEETPDENDVAAETGDEQAAEPKGTYFRHGRGKYIEGEYSYDGEWEHDVLSGKGTFTYASGSSYTGSFVAGKYHGEGKYEWPNGTHYFGSWHEGVMHGDGTYTDVDGREWSGHFFNGTGPGLQAILT